MENLKFWNIHRVLYLHQFRVAINAVYDFFIYFIISVLNHSFSVLYWLWLIFRKYMIWNNYLCVSAFPYFCNYVKLGKSVVKIRVVLIHLVSRTLNKSTQYYVSFWFGGSNEWHINLASWSFNRKCNMHDRFYISSKTTQ